MGQMGRGAIVCRGTAVVYRLHIEYLLTAGSKPVKER